MIDLELNSSTDLKREGKSFYWASFFLPKSSKKNAGILYSICRYFDDIADKHSQDQSNYLKNSIEEIKNNKNNKVNVFLKKNNINDAILIDLIDGLILDQKNIRIQNKEELIKYSYHVACTVGLMMSKIIGVKHKKASKSAIETLTKQWAVEIAPIRVNAIAPGLILTEGTGVNYQGDMKDKRANAVPLKRVGEAIDVANAAAFLVSEDASYVTGQIIDVDGGLGSGSPQR